MSRKVVGRTIMDTGTSIIKFIFISAFLNFILVCVVFASMSDAMNHNKQLKEKEQVITDLRNEIYELKGIQIEEVQK